MTLSPRTSTAARPIPSDPAPQSRPSPGIRALATCSPRRRAETDPDSGRLRWLKHAALAEIGLYLLCGAAVLAASLLAACASGPDLRRVVTITERDAAEFSYEQALDGGIRSFRQGLVNDGLFDAADFYSSPGTDPFTKVISTEQLQVLVDALAARGFFDYAREDMAPGSVSRLALQFSADPVGGGSGSGGLGGRRYVWSKQPGIQADELRAYNQALVDFQNVYNAVTSYHTGKGSNAVTERHRANVEGYRPERVLRLRHEDDGR